MPAATSIFKSQLFSYISILVALIFVLTISLFPLEVSASGLNGRSLELLNSAPGSTTDYSLSFTFSNSSTIGSLSLLFCSNDPVQDDSCSLPAGLDVTNVQLTYQSGITDFHLFVAATNNIILSRISSAVVAPLKVTLTFHNIINPNTAGPYYLRLGAYSSNDATGSTVDYGGLAFATTSNLEISSVVPPYLIFCSGIEINGLDCTSASGAYINFGDLSSTHSVQAASQLLVATNAPNGYVMQVYGTTMTAGNDSINAMQASTGTKPGSAQFGINLRSNTDPVIGADPTGPGSGQPAAGYDSPNKFQFVSNDVIAASLSADDYRKYTVSYLVNISSSQPPGVYDSSLTYVCAGSF